MPDSPWSKDLETTFADPEIREAVDSFLRGTVQPHVTRLEQQSADALELYKDLQNEDTAAQAYYSITEALFGDELADRVLAALDADAAAETPEPATPDDEIKELLEERRANKQAQEYRNALDELKQSKGLGDDFHEDLFHPFVAGAGGDLDRAYDSYQEYMTQFASRLGGQPITPDAIPDPPPTLGDAPPAPPTEKQYLSVRDALDDFFAEQAVGPPPTVGSV